MSLEMEFYTKIVLTFAASGVIYYFMHLAQKRKEVEAEAKYQFVLKLIEMRNKRHE